MSLTLYGQPVTDAHIVRYLSRMHGDREQLRQLLASLMHESTLQADGTAILSREAVDRVNDWYRKRDASTPWLRQIEDEIEQIRDKRVTGLEWPDDASRDAVAV